MPGMRWGSDFTSWESFKMRRSFLEGLIIGLAVGVFYFLIQICHLLAEIKILLKGMGHA